MMPVGQNDRMIGAISNRDIVIRAVSEGNDCDTQVRDVMSEGVAWASENDTVARAIFSKTFCEAEFAHRSKTCSKL